MNTISEPAGIFAVVMAAAVAAPYLSDKLGIPTVASLTLMGILLGPHAANVLEPNVILQFIGSLGMIYVFFIAGSEVDIGMMRRRSRSSALFGAFTFFIPFLAGAGFGMILFRQSLFPSLIMGAFFASSGSLAISPGQRSDLLSRESAETGRGGASLSRALIAIVLLASSVVFKRESLLALAKDIAFYFLYFAALWLVLPRLAALFIQKVRLQGALDAVFVLLLVYGAAFLAQFAGIPGYIGAFFSGILLSRFVSASNSISSKMRFIGDSLFLPFLLIFIGVSADFSRGPLLPATLLLVAGSVVFGLGSKFLAAFLAGRALSYSKADRGLLFGFSSSFAAFSLAIAAVAGSSGFFDQSLVTGAILLVIISSSIASIVTHSSGSSILVAKSGGEAFAKTPGERIMIALSKPSTAHALMDIGMALHGPASATPVYPLAIIQDTDPEGEAKQHAETMLAAAVMQGVAAQIPVIPVSKVSVNVAQGILDSADEQDADTVIIGWNKPPRLANAFFGSVIDQIVGSGGHMVLVSRMVTPLWSAHVMAVMPAFCYQHPGFPRAALALAAIIRKSQSKLHVVTLSGHGPELGRALKESGLESISQIIEIPAWKDIDIALRQAPSTGFAFVLMSARPSEPAWHPAIERLPHRLGEEFPQANLIMIYFPSPLLCVLPKAGAGEMEGVAAAGGRPALRMSPSRILDEAVSAGTVRVDMRHTAVADGVFELVSSAFPFDRKMASRLGGKLTEIVQRQPIEIEPGVVIIHDRVPGIERPILCMGSHRQGFRVSVLEQPVRILVIILVPEGQSPEKHLEYLGEIATLFREKDLARRLLEAGKAMDIL